MKKRVPCPCRTSFAANWCCAGHLHIRPRIFPRRWNGSRTEEMNLAPWIVHAPLEEGGAWFERLLNAPGAVAKVLLVPNVS